MKRNNKIDIFSIKELQEGHAFCMTISVYMYIKEYIETIFKKKEIKPKGKILITLKQ